MIEDEYRYLAHLFGPKCENEELVSKLISSVLLDYAHWRRNYYPDDPRTMPPSDQRDLENETDKLLTQTHAMLAGLRRSFPFYSPRYIAHQQSETTIASLVGAIAGTLYNSNNVTPESGIATVEWEIDACNDLLRMIGYRPPPDPMNKSYADYTHELKGEFGWCHLCSGGTVANIEALWVARIVKYFPLAVRDACIAESLVVDVKLADGREVDIGKVKEEDLKDLIGLKPNESLYLLAKFVNALRKSRDAALEDASKAAWDVLNTSCYSPANGMGASSSRFSPVIFVSGAAHYSIKKAADLLGIGRNAVRPVPMDANFRIDIPCLKEAIEIALRQGHCVLAVIAIAGTTEEGAIDPLHEILKVRAHFERTRNHSFWVHVDGAWGGFLRTLFVDEDAGKEHVSLQLFMKRLPQIQDLFRAGPYSIPLIEKVEEDVRPALDELIQRLEQRAQGEYEPHNKIARLKAALATSRAVAHETGNYAEVLSSLYKYARGLGLPVTRPEFQINLDDRISKLREFMAYGHELRIKEPKYEKPVHITWPFDPDVGKAVFAFEEADSITVDPHKMGYAVYPNGAIAFKNDRIRHFVQQKAPYITESKANALVHLPIRHAEPPERELAEDHITTQAFGPFTLEGSRPSTSACSLWLSSKTMPFDRTNHGMLVRSSLLSARVFYEWILHWTEVQGRMKEDPKYKLLLYTAHPPDSNIVVFAVKRRGDSSIERFNKLNEAIYSKFSIQSELGRRDHSYSQPFFLSKTSFKSEEYPFRTIKKFFVKKNFKNQREHYEKFGLIVLRASVMNPYLLPIQKNYDYFARFMMNLHEVANAAIKAMP